jgi:sugar phosphate isomerase/epimerase
LSLADDLALAAELDIPLGLAMHKLTAQGDPLAAVAEVIEAEVTVTHLWARNPLRLHDPESWSKGREHLGDIMDVALALRPGLIVLSTGNAGSLTWERAADALDENLRGTVRECEREGLRLALEPTPAALADLGFVHTLRDVIELGWRLGTLAVLDIDTCWNERNLVGTLTAGADDIALVQVADRDLATHAVPDRLVPGEGGLPLQRIMGQLVDDGYAGWFELELVGPTISSEDPHDAVTRGVDALRALLAALAKNPDDPL